MISVLFFVFFFLTLNFLTRTIAFPVFKTVS